jgi:hypothetical protein
MNMRSGARVRSRRGAVALVAFAGALALGACGGGSSSKTTPTSAASSSGSAANGKALTAYRQCLLDHGVTGGRRPTGTSGAPVPDTGTPPSSRAPLTPDQQAKRQAAQQACQSKLPPGYLQQRQQDLAAYRSCLKDHGVKLPADPNGTGSLRGVNRNDPTFQAAQKVCAPLMPSGGGFGPGGGSGGGSTTSGAPAALAAPARATV